MSRIKLRFIPGVRFLCRVFLLAALAVESCWLHGMDKLEVQVETAEGGSIHDVKVVVVQNNKVKTVMIPTHREGVYTTNQELDPGEYTIVVCDGPTREPDVKEIHKADWEGSHLKVQHLTLGPAQAQVAGRVLNVSNKPVAGAMVIMKYKYLGCESTSQFKTKSDKEGFYRIEGLPVTDRRMTLVVTPPLRFKTPPQDMEAVDLTLEEGLSARETGATTGPAPTPSVNGGAAGAYRTRVSTAISVEATFSQRILSTRRFQLNLEFPFAFRPSTTVTSVDHPSVVKEYRAFFFTPSMHLTLLVNRRIYPWFSLGSGLALFVPGSVDQNGMPVPPTVSSTSKLAFQGGAGVDYWPLHCFGLRTQIRNFYSGPPNLGLSGINLRNNLFVGAGFLIRR